MSMGYTIPQIGRQPLTTAPCDTCARDTPHKGSFCLVCKSSPPVHARPRMTRRQVTLYRVQLQRDKRAAERRKRLEGSAQKSLENQGAATCR